MALEAMRQRAGGMIGWMIVRAARTTLVSGARGVQVAELLERACIVGSEMLDPFGLWRARRRLRRGVYRKK